MAAPPGTDLWSALERERRSDRLLAAGLTTVWLALVGTTVLLWPHVKALPWRP